jgi:hypothetical protein
MKPESLINGRQFGCRHSENRTIESGGFIGGGSWGDPKSAK